jgi:ABC-type antimicrobial peptide transport system permease subunit
MALGAQPRNILTDVLVEGVVMAGLGVAAGVALSFVLERVAGKFIADLHQAGALAFIASAALILVAALIASAAPAARAARVNAVEALRAE